MNRIISDENGTKLEYDSLPDLFADLIHILVCVGKEMKDAGYTLKQTSEKFGQAIKITLEELVKEQ